MAAERAELEARLLAAATQRDQLRARLQRAAAVAADAAHCGEGGGGEGELVFEDGAAVAGEAVHGDGAAAATAQEEEDVIASLHSRIAQLEGEVRQARQLQVLAASLAGGGGAGIRRRSASRSGSVSASGAGSLAGAVALSPALGTPLAAVGEEQVLGTPLQVGAGGVRRRSFGSVISPALLQA